MKNLLSVILICTLFSCSPEKRLARLIEKHPELVKRDTIWRSDTIRTQLVTKDTVFNNAIIRDTVIVHKDNMTIKYVNNGKTIYLKGTCDPITIIKKEPVYVNTVSPIKEVHVIRWYDWVSYCLSTIFIIALILRAKDELK